MSWSKPSRDGGFPALPRTRRRLGVHIQPHPTHRQQTGFDFCRRKIRQEISRDSECIQQPLLFPGNTDDEISLGELLHLNFKCFRDRVTADHAISLTRNERLEILRERNNRDAVLAGDHRNDHPCISRRLPQYQTRIVYFLELMPIRQDGNAKLSQNLQGRSDG